MASRQRGITLIELMIVVAIVGILAAIAVYMFTKQTKQAKASEVNAIFAEIQLRQEAHHLERGFYATTGSDDSALTQFYPDQWDPEDHEQDLELSPSAAPQPWLDLRFNPDRNLLYCVYLTIGDADGADGTIGDNPQASIASANTNMASTEFDLCEQNPPDPNTECSDLEAPSGGYFYMVAQCDFDGDDDNSTFFAVSFADGMAQLNKGE